MTRDCLWPENLTRTFFAFAASIAGGADETAWTRQLSGMEILHARVSKIVRSRERRGGESQVVGEDAPGKHLHTGSAY